jgi:protein SCO1
MSRRALVAALVVGIIGAGALAGVLLSARGTPDAERYRGSPPPGGLKLPAFELESYRGGRVGSSSLRGKVVALTFLESRCQEACPVIAFALARGVERLSPAQREHVEAIAISTHPLDDTPASVRAFLQKQRALGALDYLIGSERELRPVWRRFNILAALDSGDASTHSASVHIYDRRGVWVSTLHPSVDLTAESFAHDVALALES